MTRARMPAINWLDSVIVALFAAGDGAIVWLAIAALLRSHNPDRHVVAPLAIGVGLLLANLVPRAVAGLQMRWQIGYTLTAVGFVATIAIWVKSGAFPATSWLDPSWVGGFIDGFAIKGAGVGEVVWLSVIGAGAAWRLGGARSVVDVAAANDHLRQGAIACVAALALNAVVSGGVSNSAASLAAVVFFASSLTAIAAARSTMMLGGVDVGRTRSPAVIAGPAAVAVGVGLLAGALVSRQLFDTLIWLLGYPVGWIWFVARYVLIALAFVFFIVLWPIFWLLERLPTPSPPVMPVASPPAQQPGPMKAPNSPALGAVPDWVKFGVAALVFVIVCLVVLRIASSRKRAQQVAEDEVREKLPGEQAGSLLSDLWNRLRKRPPVADPLADLRGKPDWAYTIAIREAFGQFLEWTREQGVARRPAATAAEHVATVEAALSGPNEDAEQLLAGYQNVRFRSTPATQAEAAAAVEAWRRLQRQEPEAT